MLPNHTHPSAGWNGTGLPHRPKLSRTFLFSLPAGPFLVSGCMLNGRPVFAECVVPAAARAAQWGRIKAAGANGRLCDLFDTPEAFRRSPQGLFCGGDSGCRN